MGGRSLSLTNVRRRTDQWWKKKFMVLYNLVDGSWTGGRAERTFWKGGPGNTQ